MNKYKLFKAISGRKIYLAVDMDISVSNIDAIRIAEGYFKAGKNNLICTIGRRIGNDLYLDETAGKYPNPLGVEKTDVWVITRKCGWNDRKRIS